MAHETIYVCDGCGSFADPKTLHHLAILINRASSYNSSVVPIESLGSDGRPMTLHREICSKCAERLRDEFELNKTIPNAHAAFANFERLLNGETEPR